LQVVTTSATAMPSAGRTAVQRLGIRGTSGHGFGVGDAVADWNCTTRASAARLCKCLPLLLLWREMGRRVLQRFDESDGHRAARAPQRVLSGARGESGTLTGLPPGDFELASPPLLLPIIPRHARKRK